MLDSISNRWNELPASDRRAVGICAAFLFIVAAYIGVAEPLISRFESTSAELNTLRELQSSNTRKLNLLPRRESRLNEYRGQLAGLENRFSLKLGSVEQAVSRTVPELTYYARLSGLTIGSIRPQSSNEAGDFYEVPFELDATGSYHGLRKFIYYIDTSPSVLAVTRFEMKPAEAGTIRASLQVTDVIQLSDSDELPSDLQDQYRLRLAVPAGHGFLALQIAEQQGLLDSPKYRVELVNAHDRITIERLLLSKQLDGVGINLADLPGYWIKGIPLKIIRTLSRSHGSEAIVVSENSGIRKTSELAGITIAVDEEGILPFVLDQALGNAGVETESVERTPLNAAQVARDMRNGMLIAGVTREPYLSQLLQENSALQVYSSTSTEDRVTNLLAVTDETAIIKGEVLHFVASAVDKAFRLMEGKPQLAIDMLISRHGITQQRADTILHSTEYLDEEHHQKFVLGPALEERINTLEAWYIADGQSFPLITADDLIIQSPLPESLPSGVSDE